MSKRVLLPLLVICTMFSVNASGRSVVLPILSTYTDAHELIIAYSGTGASGAGKDVILASALQFGYGTKVMKFVNLPSGDYLSFSYVTKHTNGQVGQWYSGGEAMQLAFHPDDYYLPEYSNSPLFSPLYAFSYERGTGLRLVSIMDETSTLIFDFGIAYDAANFPVITVFSGGDIPGRDIIVVSIDNDVKAYNLGDMESGVRQISSTNQARSYFGINGQKYDEPQQGLNIVVDGETSKKIVVK